MRFAVRAAERAATRLSVPTRRLTQASVARRACATAAQQAAPFLSDERIRVDPSYNRWLQMIPACAAGIGIGTYASVPAVLGPFVCRAQGVVAQAPTDFAVSDLLPYRRLA